jgi:hypothetical protein
LTPPTLTALDLNRLVFRGLRAHKAAQLNHAVEGLDVDFGGFERRFIEDRRLDC